VPSRRNRSIYSSRHEEPLFTAVPKDDPDMLRAFALAAATVSIFKRHVLRPGEQMCYAKLQFRDPEWSERLGEDRFAFIWLCSVFYHTDDRLFSGIFYDLPEEYLKWHKIGERLAFKDEDIFDWMVNDGGRLHGGFTERVIRARLPARDRKPYDKYMGVTSWEPLPSPDGA
jgi:uncharacterized protein YegJ (DUF2314 family)